jgi:MFS family permease
MSAPSLPHSGTPQALTSAQRRGFWAAWAGWTLDGMDSFIFPLVLTPVLTELLPKSGLAGSPPHVVFAGPVLFAVFLMGWGSSLIWGPLADRRGRARMLAAAVACYAVFSAAAARAQNVWQLGLFRFLAGVGIDGEWALAVIGIPVAATALAFLLGLLILPFCLETRGQRLPA